MQQVSRLITSFTPAAYHLSLSLQRTERTFHGVVTIQGSTHQNEHFRLHAKTLSIKSVTVDGRSAAVSFHENDELEITQDNLSAGSHTVMIAFSGTITDAMHGMYPCYFDHNGIKKELLATQFESHHAREVFPCIDEPEAKATFDVILSTEQGVDVLSNMPIQSQREENDQLITTFATTPRMSSYLLAWVVGELHKLSATTKSGVEVNVWATPNQPVTSLRFALDIATRTIDFYDEYFDTPYPLPKSDHVALPDFSSGAMENWGLITYREIALLADPETTSVSAKHYIATVVAHELAHQWFGNLVTMKWWNDLWLNESFATLMEYIAIDALEPQWNVWLDFASNESVAALRRDAIDGVQAVQVDVNHPDEISTLFDGAIVYAKGARLLRMLQTYVGDADFQTGLSAYFKEHAYKNTEANDLWRALSAASGKDIEQFMTAWISLPGYPVVEMNDTTITQTQFFIGEHSESSHTWQIPLDANDERIPTTLSESSLTIDAPETAQLNMSDSAHFITSYSPTQFRHIVETIATQPVINRLQFMNEQSLLARGGKVSTASLIPLLMNYRHESAESVWDIMALTFGELKKFVESDEAAEAKLRTLSGYIADAQYDRLGWTEQATESETDTKLRATILSMMVYSERRDVIDHALSLYDKTNLESIPAEYRSLVIAAAVKYSDSTTIVDELLTTYQTTNSADLRQDITAGVSATKDPTIAQRLLDLSKDSSIIKNQDAFRWFIYLIRGRYSRATAWSWLKENWPWVKQTFSGDKSYDDYPRYAAGGLLTATELEEYRAFFEPMKSEPALKRTIELGIIEIAARVDLLERDGDDVRRSLLDLDI